MEVRYKRDMNRNYMILPQVTEADYQIKMICTNQIKGLLNAHTCKFNGCEEIYYDISSRQPISRLYAKREMNHEDIRMILSSIQELLEEAKRYLLDGSNILFLSDYCYCNPETGNAEWVLYPGGIQRDDFMELAEFLIEKVDHKDSRAVDVAYRFFKRVKEGSFVMSEFMSEMLQEKEEEKNSIEEPMPCCDETFIAESYDEKAVSWGEKIKKYIKSKIKHKINIPERLKEEDVKRYPKENWETYGINESYNGETLVMGVHYDPSQRYLKRMEKGSTECISLSKLPCVLGKMAECADVVLHDKSVSRMHAKIFEEDGEVYLQDLNSTNGSFLNGLQLETNEILKIKVGDEIGIGNLRYRYE